MFTYTGKGKSVFRKYVMRQGRGDAVPHQHTISSSYRDDFYKAGLAKLFRTNCDGFVINTQINTAKRKTTFFTCPKFALNSKVASS